MTKQFLWNSDNTIKLGPCRSCGGKPELVATHVKCSNPRCEYFKIAVRDTTWTRDYKQDGVTARAKATWI